MEFTFSFIRNSAKFATLESSVPAPLFRRVFSVKEGAVKVTLQISSPGFYEAHLNGEDITKGFLAPYRSNPDHFVYYDEYDLTSKVVCGENVLGCIAGNGIQNASGACVWKFDQAPWRGAPCIAFAIEVTYENGDVEIVVSDKDTKSAPSAIVFDDLHYGEYYDARLEQDGWDTIGFNDSAWSFAQWAPSPRGERRLCEVEPIVAHGELKAVSITPYGDGYIYDFGENNTGLCRLTIEGEEGQKIRLRHCETLVDGKPYFRNIRFVKEDRYIDNDFDRYAEDDFEPYQEDEYICRGGTETHLPRFTYHGFRYVWVTGVRPEQATQDLLTYVLFSSDVSKMGQFTCDNETINRIQDATVRSSISNFHYFPTDCPQREKNGWTADISLSAEEMLLNLAPEKSYREWLLNVYKAMNAKGQLPGIIPTAGWGYHWGNGPAWDNVIVNVPYFTYKYRGDKDILREVATPLMRYLTYLYSKLDERSLMCFGLGDWCQPNREWEGDYTTSLVVTDSILTVDIASKAAFIYDVLQMQEQKQYALALANRVKAAIRTHLIDFNSMTIEGCTQTGQSMAVFYNILTDEEKSRAVERLVELIHENDDFLDVGVLGGRVMFRVLAEYGYADLALRMITRPEYPSYGNWIQRGATTLWEGFWKETGERKHSMNHHFWGDVSAWFYTYLAGMHINPTAMDIQEMDIAPVFPSGLTRVEASHQLPSGEVRVAWTRTSDTIQLVISAPKAVHGRIVLPPNWKFAQGETVIPLQEGIYKLSCC